MVWCVCCFKSRAGGNGTVAVSVTVLGEAVKRLCRQSVPPIGARLHGRAAQALISLQYLTKTCIQSVAMFRAISSASFDPFGKLHVEFPLVENKPDNLAEVHVLTGVNGTGKTRILSVIAAALGNPAPLLKRLKNINGKNTFLFADQQSKPGTPITWAAKFVITNNSPSWNAVSDSSHSHSLLHNFTNALGIPAFAYSGTAYLAQSAVSPMAKVAILSRTDALSFIRPPDESKVVLQALTNIKVQAAMDSMGGQDELAKSLPLKISSKIESVVSEITGRSFRFFIRSYPTPTFIVQWGGSELSVDHLPDGLRSILGWLVHSVVMLDAMKGGQGDPFDLPVIFLLDEIESHLHPAWQRRVLPAFQKMFPKAQMFVATHSPFMISSLNHGWIHSFSIGKDNLVSIAKPVAASAGDSYMSVVEDIMGLKEWYDPETESLLSEFRKERDIAFGGDVEAEKRAQILAETIGKRSMELDYTMGKELTQMRHQLQRKKG